MFFFFKQKTAYELRISDWSSDVCSSDLAAAAIIACAATAQEAPKASVEAPKVPFTETRYGRTVDDPYRWMEDPKRASELARYVREQSNITIDQLADLPQRDRLDDLIDETSRAGTPLYALRISGERTFWQPLISEHRRPKPI